MSPTPAHIMEPAIAALPLLDQSGQLRQLHTLWSEGTAVIVFLRHFG